MEVEKFHIEGPLLIKGKRFHDERGYFSEIYNKAVFDELGLPEFVQDNLSQSKRGVFRGMHWQTPPYAQGKLVTCLSGSIRDFIVDIRLSSPTFGQSIDVTLSGGELRSFWVPEGFAHGFESLEDESVVFYKVTAAWNPANERSLSYLEVVDKPSRISLSSSKDLGAPKLSEIPIEDLFS